MKKWCAGIVVIVYFVVYVRDRIKRNEKEVHKQQKNLYLCIFYMND